MARCSARTSSVRFRKENGFASVAHGPGAKPFVPGLIVDMSDYVAWSGGKFWCQRCQTPLPLEMRQDGTPVCGACHTIMETEKANVAVTNALAVAAKELTEVEPRHRGSVRADLAMSAFMQGIGGEVSFGQKFAEKFNDVMDSPEATAKEKRIWLFQSLKFTQKQQELDQSRPPDLSEIPEDELFAIMRPVAIELLRDNAAFRATVLHEIGVEKILESLGISMIEGQVRQLDEVPL